MQPEPDLTLRDLVDALRRQLWIVLVTPVATTLIAAAAVYAVISPTYQATATVAISTARLQARLEQRIALATEPTLNFEEYRAIATSRTVLDEVLQRLPDAGPVPTAWQEDAFTAESLNKTLELLPAGPSPTDRNAPARPPAVIQHIARAPTPEAAAGVANLWAEVTLSRVNALPRARTGVAASVVEGQISEARTRFEDAQEAWAEFSRDTTLQLDKASLDSAVSERVRLDTALADAQRALAADRAQLAANERALAAQARVVPNPAALDTRGTVSTSDLATGLGLAGLDSRAALASVDRSLQETAGEYEAASAALETFRAGERIDLLQSQVAEINAQLARITIRLETIETDLKSRQARLAEVTRALSAEPRLTELERRLSSDPAVARAIAERDPLLGAILGARLLDQQLNPTHASLLLDSINLRAAIEGLQAEKAALARESETLTGELARLKPVLARQLRQREGLTARQEAARNLHSLLLARKLDLETINAGLTGSPITYDNPNPEYQRLRTLVLDGRAAVERAQANIGALQNRIRALDVEITRLKPRVADAQVALDRLNQNLQLTTSAHSALAQTLTDVRIEAASGEALTEVLTPAFPPVEHVSPRRGLTLTLALVLGGMLGIMAAFVTDALRSRPLAPGAQTVAEPAPATAA